MKCEDLLKALNGYVDGVIDPAVCEEFQKHLDGCNPCQVVVDNIRQTIKLYQGQEEYPMPPGFQETLRQRLREKWLQRFGST
jgi:hypothetical protein